MVQRSLNDTPESLGVGGRSQPRFFPGHVIAEGEDEQSKTMLSSHLSISQTKIHVLKHSSTRSSINKSVTRTPKQALPSFVNASNDTN